MVNTVFIFLLSIFLISCGSKQVKIKPMVENITESAYASGFVKTKDQYQVFSPVNGVIKKIFIAEGDTVKKDAPILQVASETARLNIDNAQLATENAALAANRNKLDELKTNLDFLESKMQSDSMLMERQRNLWRQQIGTRNELDQRELAYKTAVTAYKAAMFRYQDLYKQLSFAAAQSRNNLKISKSIAGDFTVRSVISGRVYNVLKEEGEMVTTLSPVAVIGGTQNFILQLQVDEYDIGKIEVGQKVWLTMDSYKNRVWEATVTRIIPFMNERTRSFTVEACFITEPPALYPNLTVEANILIRTKFHTLTIPREYLLPDTSVLLPKGKKRKVKTGLQDYQKVEITSGLDSGEFIIKPHQ